MTLPSRLRRAIGAPLVALVLPACSSITLAPEGPGRGSFRAEARAVRFLGRAIPDVPIARAMERVSDRELVDVRVRGAWTFPDLAEPFATLNRILGVEAAIVEGDYGLPPP